MYYYHNTNYEQGLFTISTSTQHTDGSFILMVQALAPSTLCCVLTRQDTLSTQVYKLGKGKFNARP